MLTNINLTELVFLIFWQRKNSLARARIYMLKTDAIEPAFTERTSFQTSPSTVRNHYSLFIKRDVCASPAHPHVEK